MISRYDGAKQAEKKASMGEKKQQTRYKLKALYLLCVDTCTAIPVRNGKVPQRAVVLWYTIRYHLRPTTDYQEVADPYLLSTSIPPVNEALRTSATIGVAVSLLRVGVRALFWVETFLTDGAPHVRNYPVHTVSLLCCTVLFVRTYECLVFNRPWEGESGLNYSSSSSGIFSQSQSWVRYEALQVRRLRKSKCCPWLALSLHGPSGSTGIERQNNLTRIAVSPDVCRDSDLRHEYCYSSIVYSIL